MLVTACVALSLAAGAPGTSGADGTAAGRAQPPDCGLIALYTLMRLENFQIGPADLLRRLPAPPPSGWSLEELRAAASASGFGLRGVLLNRRESAIDRPMLAFIKLGSHGHFLVVRPVGHTGRLAQIIDSQDSSKVVDKSFLIGAEGWTGLALVPDPFPWLRRGTLGLVAFLTAGFVSYVFLKRRSPEFRHEPARSGPPV